MILDTKAHVFWLDLASGARSTILMLSPYLTGPLAEEILSTSERSRVYTRFDAELFASRASSLAVLQQLIEAGHQLFHLDALHAKVVIAPKEFATVGSQNVTSNGQKNLELSGYFSDAESVARVHSLIEPWLGKAVPITLQMIKEMEVLLPPLMEVYDAFHVACVVAQKKISRSAASGLRRAELEKVERTQAELKSEIMRALEAAPISEEWDLGIVHFREAGQTSLFSSSRDLITWTVAGRSVALERLSRYLCITDAGEVGWARVAQTRISMVGRGIDFREKIIAERPTWRVEVDSRKDYLDGLPKDANLIITVKQYGRKLCVIPMRFALSSYKTFAPRRVSQSDGAESAECQNARAWIREHRVSFEQQVIYRITRTFKYGSNLLGEDATFFGKPESEHVIRVALIRGNPVLFVKSGSRP
ncbi:phosphatidylserine/phosphatidylglycerophosphate/cardiolipin synthase family protein [Pseudomonas indoloxydans]|jgi:hypothetical protein|uniref:Phosphatidylserine/phosphatidylglycerophosphate/ cardiolipin synthase family protein n=2 Tax=Pseudomonadaceae TaxID=135621 RepID=A0A2T5PN90_ECTOL|nr:MULTISPECIES: phospholipase D-like domain-containing protein [Pseudomonadaceae]ETF05944.1 hypothetical protein PMO01_23515 [Pseudomonas moraviensis R28-S]MBV5601939.1 phosphatidylserine/phosphatidylglycerophosphate/cardiolipin synthase family protein [Pseudomonas aeruginosa]MDA0424644.1 phospholipase D-like domain-containing protein [Stutzerimonas frequens]PTU79126.1 phosphatidylserine/phosphatidylglycerophosphate/cardiolipin synthase family protein [Pseudomonas indoloxydans]RPW44370.1 hypo|tara:strand:+ start:1005 stop:2264 length:1260 start_codon:yes stop_codon:yes gene_type:complete